MKRILINSLAALGVLFIVLLCAVLYFFVTDPYNLKPLLFGTTVPVPESVREMISQRDVATTTPVIQLSEQQKEAVAAIGIDPESIPISVSTVQEDCFVRVLGESRVAEIIAGAVPSALEIQRGRECIQ